MSDNSTEPIGSTPSPNLTESTPQPSQSQTHPSQSRSKLSEISRSDLILLLQKLQKRSAITEQQMKELKQKLEQAEETIQKMSQNSIKQSPSEDSSTQLLQSQVDSLQHHSQELESEVKEWKRRALEAEERMKTSSLNAVSPSPSPAPSGSGSSSLSPPSSNGSFLLEHTNKELRSALAAEQAKNQSAEETVATLQSRLSQLEQELNHARTQSQSHSSSNSNSSSTSLSANNDVLAKRVLELETKLTKSDNKLVKSVQLISEEKKKFQTAQEELTTLQTKLSQCTAALSSSADLLKETQLQLTSERALTDQLRSDLVRLQSKFELDGGESDPREFRKTLQSKDEHILALENELDHLRTIHARQISQFEDELSRTTRQLESELEDERMRVERLTTEMAQEKHHLVSENEEIKAAMNRQRQNIEEMKSSMETFEAEKKQLLDQLAQLQEDYNKLQSSHSVSMESHQSTLDQVQSTLNDKYTRLLHELKQYKIHMITTTTTLQNELQSAHAHIRQLEDDIQHGQPHERRLWELATLQSSRDERLREMEEEVGQHRARVTELTGRLEQARVEKEFLQSELRQQQLSHQRSTVNIDYLKSVIVGYISAEGNPTKRSQLIPVLSQLLCFNPSDVESIRQGIEEANSSNSLVGGFWGKLIGSSTSSSNASKKIQLPPTVPMGIQVDHLPSPFDDKSSIPSQNAIDNHDRHKETLPSQSSASSTIPSSQSHSPQSLSMENIDINGAVAIESNQ